MIVEAHAPMPQEEISHVPKIDQQEEILHVTTIIQQADIHQQQAVMVTDAPVPMTQEESGCINAHSSNGVSVAIIGLIHGSNGASVASSSSAWGDCALYTASPLRTIENELGVQTMEGSFDTAGFAEVPVPMSQGEIVHAPTIIQQDRIQQQHVEMSVEEAVPRTQEEIQGAGQTAGKVVSLPA